MNAPLGFERVSKRYGSHVVVDDVTLTIEPDEVVALVGESGSGKSTLVRMAAGLEEPSSGHIRRDGDMQVILQDAPTTLSPRWDVRTTLSEAWVVRKERPPEGALEEALRRVGLSEELLPRRPHELSGGQKQRVAIARALVGDPRLLVLDEPLSGLDVSVAAQLLELLVSLTSAADRAMLLVTHDLAAARRIADRVAVMDAGRIVEVAETEALFGAPTAPATRRLVDALARLSRTP